MEQMSLSTATVLYNLTMVLLLGLATFWFVRAKPENRSLMRFGIGLVCLGLSCVFVAVVLSLPPFNPLRAARLLCFGWFLHLPLYASLGAVFAIQRGVRLFAGMIVVVTGFLVAYAFFVEPFRLEVSRLEIRSSKVDKPFSIAVLADFQTDRFTAYEKRSLDRLMQEKPDLILMAGDYLQADSEEDWERLCVAMRSYLGEIGFGAPLGVFGVGGNTDFQRWPEIFNGLEVNRFRSTRSIAGEEFDVTGLSIEDSFDPHVCVARPHDEAIHDTEDASSSESGSGDKLHIVLGHAPDFALSDQVDADLLVAGHTHGGQVRLPWIGPLVIFSRVPRAWAAGLTTLGNERHLVVSRGVGMERRDAPRLRFLCRPQLFFLDVVPN